MCHAVRGSKHFKKNKLIMKKIHTTFFFVAAAIIASAQGGRQAGLSNLEFNTCKNCFPQTTTVLDTICNFETDDTLVVYYADRTPFDSGWAIGHNAYLDRAWAERYAVTGSANVVGGAYLLYEKSGSASSSGTALGKVYNTAGTGGKPGTSLGQANIPFSSMTLTWPPAPTMYTFATPIPVTTSFFMVFELGTYTLTGPDTIAVVTSKNGNRSTSNNDQNCAQFSDNSWNFELTENYTLKVTYGLCAIVDIAGGVENYVSKGDLKLYAAYPNPSSSDVTINFSLDNASKTSLEIFDAQGKSMMNIEKGNLSAGMHLEKVDVSSFPSGNYFYNVKTENGTVYSRFSITK